MLKPKTLTKAERQIIRKICRVQIESLNRILKNEVEDEDIPLYCISWDIDEWELRDSVEFDISLFNGIAQNPRAFFSMDDEYLPSCRHILYNHFNKSKWRNAKRAIRRKLDLIEKQPYYFSLN